jgi:hypothetical protein
MGVPGAVVEYDVITADGIPWPDFRASVRVVVSSLAASEDITWNASSTPPCIAGPGTVPVPGISVGVSVWPRNFAKLVVIKTGKGKGPRP